MIAAMKGDSKIIELLLQNKTIDINICDPLTGINSFWLACLYGHGHIMQQLANSGADILVKNMEHINVLHLAIYKN